MLRSDLCDYSDAYIVEKGTITVEGDNMLHLDHAYEKSIKYL